jgi:hypothetical protein
MASIEEGGSNSQEAGPSLGNDETHGFTELLTRTIIDLETLLLKATKHNFVAGDKTSQFDDGWRGQAKALLEFCRNPDYITQLYKKYEEDKEPVPRSVKCGGKWVSELKKINSEERLLAFLTVALENESSTKTCQFCGYEFANFFNKKRHYLYPSCPVIKDEILRTKELSEIDHRPSVSQRNYAG